MDDQKTLSQEVKKTVKSKSKKPKIHAAKECLEPELGKLHAVILHKDTKDAKPVNVPPDAGKFSFGDQTYNIREGKTWRFIKHKLQFEPPFVKTIQTLWSFYRAGHPEPLGWEPTDKFTAEDISVIDELDTTIQGMSDSMKGEKIKRQVGGLKWLILLLIAVVGAIIAIFVLPGILKHFGIIGGGGG